MSESATHSAIETVIRQSYGQIIAYLAARSGDVAGAEDALSDAFLAALRRWPADGVPDRPEAWLLRAARNRLIDSARHDQVRLRSLEYLQQIAEEAQTMATTLDCFPDERLQLLFVCAHPAIDVAARTPLMLQTVLGIDAARIASAFLISPKAMSQRLVRAKTKAGRRTRERKMWRMGRDSNPRYLSVHTLSRRARSTALAPIRNEPTSLVSIGGACNPFVTPDFASSFETLGCFVGQAGRLRVSKRFCLSNR